MPTVPQVVRISLKNILFPTDFSSASASALPFATALSRIYGSTILPLHVLRPEPHRQVVFDRLPAEDDRDRDDARQKLAEFARDCALGNVPCKPLLDRGDLGRLIPAVIREYGVDLIVLGTHGRRGVTKLMLGSEAEKIYRSATCPVMTVGPKAREAGTDWKPRRILCPVDLANDPEPALHYALSLAEENQSQFIVLQAVPMVPWQHRTSVEERTRRSLQSLIPEQAQDWCTPEFMIRWENAAEAILSAAAVRDTDLIVMGVRKSRVAGLSAHLPWPVASEVVSRAPCPVVTVRG